MAFYYNVGTVTVANGSDQVTGTLTGFLGTIHEGDMLLLNNNIAMVKSVESNTVFTLVQPWPYTGATNSTYIIALFSPRHTWEPDAWTRMRIALESAKRITTSTADAPISGAVLNDIWFKTNGTSTLSFQQRNANSWSSPISLIGGGNVIGPATSANNSIVVFNGTDGTLIKDSGLTAQSFDAAGASEDAITAHLAASDPHPKYKCGYAVLAFQTGYDNTGATDQTAAINAAHASLPAGGGHIILGPGRLRVDGTIALTKPVTFEGSGYPGTTLVVTSPSSTPIAVSGGAAGSTLQMFQIETRSATVTISQASPAVVTQTAHGFAAGQPVVFTTAGTLPAPLIASKTYYVIATGLTTNTFQVSTTVGGAAVATTVAGSGTHTCWMRHTGGSFIDVGTVRVTVRDCYLDKPYVGILWRSSSTLCDIRDVEIRNVTPHESAWGSCGVRVDSGAYIPSAAYMIGLIVGTDYEAQKCYVGVWFKRGDALIMSNTELMANKIALLIECGDSASATSTKIDTCFFDSSEAAAMYVTTTGSGNISRIAVSNSWFTGTSAGNGITFARAVGATGMFSISVAIDNCDILLNSGSGIDVLDAAWKQIDVRNSRFGQNGVDFNVAAGVGDFDLIGNRFGDGGGVNASPIGIQIAAGASNRFSIIDNNLSGVTTTKLSNGATGPLQYIYGNPGLDFWSVPATISPAADDGGALGTTAKSWSDLFLASGGVINWNNGAYTLTQAAGNLTASGTLTVSGQIIGGNGISVSGNIVQSANNWYTAFFGSTAYNLGAGILLYGGSHASTPDKIGIYNNGFQERLLIEQNGAVKLPGIATTASAANVFLDSGTSNNLLRSTSSLVYKDNIEPIAPEIAARILELEPIWYRSKAAADNPEWSWYGLTAEQVAAIDPRLVHWGYHDDDYEEYDAPLEVEEQEVVDNKVIIIRKTVTSKQRRIKAGAQKKPDGVMYDRIGVLLIAWLKSERILERIKALEDRQ